MSTTAHSNLFPRAGETAMQPADTEKQAIDATDADVAGIPLPSSAWANPASSLQRFTQDRAPEAAESSRKPTHSDRAIAFLRENGPASARQLCAHLGVDGKAGVTPFITGAMRAGEIRREGKLYLLRDQTVASNSPDPDVHVHLGAGEENREVTTLPDMSPLPEPKPAPAREEKALRSPDFTLTVGDAMPLSWADGAVTIQRVGSFVELNASQARMLAMFSELRK